MSTLTHENNTFSHEEKEEEPLADYEEPLEHDNNTTLIENHTNEQEKGSYVGKQASGFRDFMLKPELVRALGDCGFEHPSEVQQACLPSAAFGSDLICQAKSGMGKTAVFVLSVLQQIEPKQGIVDTLVMCHTRELAYQICQEFDRFGKYSDGIKTMVIYGGVPESQHIKMLKDEQPNIIVGTPGRVLALVDRDEIKLNHIKRFILDECDNMLEALDMRRDVQKIFKRTPHDKQVLMFSATISKEMRQVCRKFAREPCEILIDNQSALTLHGLLQHYVRLKESEKTRRLFSILDSHDFNQIIIFVRSQNRAQELTRLLNLSGFRATGIYGSLNQEERIQIYRDFKDYKTRILVSTDVFARGVDIERVNIVLNYDMPKDDNIYLHRVGRAGRFGTKGLAISFVALDDDSEVLEKVQKRFEVEIKVMPEKIDSSQYMASH